MKNNLEPLVELASVVPTGCNGEWIPQRLTKAAGCHFFDSAPYQFGMLGERDLLTRSRQQIVIISEQIRLSIPPSAAREQNHSATRMILDTSMTRRTEKVGNPFRRRGRILIRGRLIGNHRIDGLPQARCGRLSDRPRTRRDLSTAGTPTTVQVRAVETQGSGPPAALRAGSQRSSLSRPSAIPGST